MAGAREALHHLALGNEGLDDAQSAQSLVEFGHNLTPLILYKLRLAFQFAAHRTHDPACDGNEEQDKDRKFPTQNEHREEAHQDGDGRLDEHIDR